jgi:NAD(P)-dependent dehydrogenase (short-subunit alcohol dehydrogenase family)
VNINRRAATIATVKNSRGTDLSGALALVTGAASGIGRETALALAGRGARVLAADLDADGAAKTAADCGGTAHTLDVADREAVTALAEQVHADHGALDVLVNNAGVGMTARFADTSLDDWDWILSINLLGVIHGCHAFGPAMVERGSGHVVNVSSGLGYTPRATEVAYVTTKAAVLALSRSLRADWGPAGVGVSVICPGVINTPIVSRTRYRGDRDTPETRAKTAELFAKRGHPPAKVAAAIVDAVEHDRAVVPVGAEARLGWFLNGLLPNAVVERIARTTYQGI